MKILLIGSEGQLGSELSRALRNRYQHVELTEADLSNKQPNKDRHFVALDVLDRKSVLSLIEEGQYDQVYHLAAILSARGEAHPRQAWDINMNGLFNVLDACVAHGVKQVYWPSSIAAFGPGTPRIDTPQSCFMDPVTVYGISKLSGELCCQYYHQRFGLDIRSLRYPGIISYATPPGGGTTDYAVEVFYELAKSGQYTSFLGPESRLPMMYIDDAIKATLDLMEAPAEKLSIHTSYNLGAISFTPAELFEEIGQQWPGARFDYAPDHRQAIADSWPASINDEQARKDWGWSPDYDLKKLVSTMIEGVKSLQLS